MAPRFTSGVSSSSVLSPLSVKVVARASVKGCDRVGAGISATPPGPSGFSWAEKEQEVEGGGCVLRGLCAGGCIQCAKGWGGAGSGGGQWACLFDVMA